jgi:hypothetical protein
MSMKLKTLEAKLKNVAGTNIGEVLMDWKVFLDIKRSKVYPVVLWSMNNAKFKNDIRPIDIQQIKEFTFTVFAIMNYDANTQDRTVLWDTLEDNFYDYLNAVNSRDQVVQVISIDNIEGEYVPEGMLSADSEIGIMAQIKIRTYCNE